MVVITDSGGITEEASVLKIPCMTIRDNTERPETIYEGTNELIGTNPKKFKDFLRYYYLGNYGKREGPSISGWKNFS